MKLTVFVHVIEIVIIAFLLLYIFVLAPSQSQPSQSSILGIPNASFNSPPDLKREISSAKDVIDDLSSLGCKLMNVSSAEAKMQSGLAVNYSDFRWITYNTKIAYYAEVPSEGSCFFTIYQGIAVVFGLKSQTSGTESGAFTKYEKVEFTSGYADLVGTNFVTSLNFKNTGSATATVDNATIFYNGKPSVAFGVTDQPSAVLNASLTETTLNLPPGESGTATITMAKGNTWVSGMTVEIMIQTVAGKQYPKVITLP